MNVEWTLEKRDQWKRERLYKQARATIILRSHSGWCACEDCGYVKAWCSDFTYRIGDYLSSTGPCKKCLKLNTWKRVIRLKHELRQYKLAVK